MKKTLIATAVGMALMGTGAANAALVTGIYDGYCGGAGPGCSWTTNKANFTMLTKTGAMQGGTNDVSMQWDGNGYSAQSDYSGLTSVANVTASSTSPFSSNLWTAHNIQVFTQGTYVFDTSLGGGNLESGNQTLTVGAGQLGMHMLFDWNGNLNIDVSVLAAGGQSYFGSGNGDFGGSNITLCGAAGANCLHNGGGGYAGGTTANRPAGNQSWMLTSIDGNGDGIPGINMAAGGPFAAFNANFNANLTPVAAVVPVPAAAWLFGSGLVGLVGVARRKKAV